MPEDNEKPHIESKRLFVGGLPDDVTKSDLEQRFGRFGSIAAINVKTKRDSEGKIVNVFAHIDINLSEASFKKCLFTYNDAKWKGRTMKVDAAKEDFLAKLAKERQEAQQSPEETKKPAASSRRAREQLESKTRLEGNMKNAGVEDFTLKSAVPGTAIPGEKNWVVGKFGRVLPIMHMRRQDKKNLATYDPSKYVHRVRKFKEDSKNDQVTTERPIEDLTWSLPDSPSEKDRKRMGEFPLQSSSKKSKSNRLTTKLEHEAERTNMKSLKQDFEIVRAKNYDRTDLVKLKPYSRKMEEKEKLNQRRRKPDDIGDLLEQCKLESDEDSCGSADTDEICSLAKKASKAKESESKNGWTDSNNVRVKSEAPSGGKTKFGKGQTMWSDNNEDTEDLNKSQQVQNREQKYWIDVEKKSAKFVKKDDFTKVNTCVKENKKQILKDQVKVLKTRTGKDIKRGGDVRDWSIDIDDDDDSDGSDGEVMEHEMEREKNNGRDGNSHDSSSENADGSISSANSDVDEEPEPWTEVPPFIESHSDHTPKQSSISGSPLVEKQGKQKRSDKVRLESMKRRQENILTQKAVIRKALQVGDSTKGSSTSMSHIRFDSDDSQSSDAKSENGPTKDEVPKRKLQGLLDSDDDSDEMEIEKKTDEERFKIKPQFQGKAGLKLLKLQNKIGTDSRFTLGERFMEKEEDTLDDTLDEDQQLQAEKQKSLTVLQGIVGSQAVNSLKKKTFANFRDPSRMRYDPTREDHAQFEIIDTRAADPSSLQKKTKVKNEVTLPKVSKDTYYEVSNLDFGQEGDDSKPFSFFGEAKPEEGDKSADEKGFSSLEKDILASATLGKRQLTLDSSENDSESENEDEKAKHDGKGNGNESHMDTAASNHQSSRSKPFFFEPDDIRLKTGPQQFCRKLSFEGINKWFEEQKAELQMEYKKRHQRALRDSKKAAQQTTKKPRR